MANQKEIDDLFGSDDEDKVEDGDEGGSTPPPPSSSSPAQGQDDDNKDDNKDDDDINGARVRSDEVDKIFADDEDKADLLSTNTPTATTTKNIALFPATRLPEKNKTIFFRTPNFVKIQSQEFRYEKHASDQERKQFDGATAVIRWKRVQQEGGGSRLASNARLLKWSDGSYQLVVGNAVFQAKLHPAENCFAFEAQKLQSVDGEGTAQGSCLECIGAVPSRMVVQPSSLDSETHNIMSVQISERHRKEKRIAVHDYEKLQMNPEKALQLMAKKEEEQMRKERKLRAQQNEVNAGRRLMSSYIKRPSMTADYLDDYDEEEDDDVGRRYDSPVKRRAPPAKKAKRKKPTRDDEEDLEDEEEEEEADDDEIDEEMRDFIADDDEEEGESLGSHDTDDDEEEDVMEEEEEEEGGSDGEEVVKKKKDKKKRKAPKEKKSKSRSFTAEEDDVDEENDVPMVRAKKAKSIFVDSDEDL
eukprot:gene9121-10071_t